MCLQINDKLPNGVQYVGVEESILVDSTSEVKHYFEVIR